MKLLHSLVAACLTVAAAQTTSPRHGCGPSALAFSGSGNLFVANNLSNTVTAYAPGSAKVLRTISQGLSYPDALAFDRSRTLYVANYCYVLKYCDGGKVIVYKSDGKLLRTIGVPFPKALAFGP